MKVLVCGGRDYSNASMVHQMLRDLQPTAVVQGGCPTGADAFAKEWALRNKVPCATYNADWSQGRKAGPLRNQRMLDEEKPDLVLAFHGGRGTADMLRRAQKAGVDIMNVAEL